LGGYDYSDKWLGVFLDEAGQRVDVLKGSPGDLCTNDSRLKFFAGEQNATREQILAAYGTPSKAAGRDGQVWFFLDPGSSQALVFLLSRDPKAKVTSVYVARYDVAVRQWYPLLGEPAGPRPLSPEDAALGPVSVGMDPERARLVLKEEPSEGERRPYNSYRFTRQKMELHFDSAVRAIFATEGSVLATPRGIRVGNSSEAVQAVYGAPRLATAQDGSVLWSYESLSNGFGLVFRILSGKVAQIAVVDSEYAYRPYAR